MSTVVPEISLISLQNQSQSDLKILKEALNSHGFFTITDHDIDDSLLDDSYTCAKEFFDLPEEPSSEEENDSKSFSSDAGSIKMEFEVEQKYCNPAGDVQGGIVSGMVDFIHGW